MLHYRGLPVAAGDAHLLMSERGAYLIDGGSGGSGLQSMLRSRGVKRLRAAVVTHFDPEHAEGVVSLLARGFPLTECWVPEVLLHVCRAAAGLSCDSAMWRRTVDEHQPEFPDLRSASSGRVSADGVRTVLAAGGRALTRLAMDCSLSHAGGAVQPELDALRARLFEPDPVQDDFLDVLVRGFLLDMDQSAKMLSLCSEDEAHLLCASVAGATCARAARPDADSALGVLLSLLARAALQLGEFPGRVRFFSCEERLVEHLVPHHHMLCLNGREVSPAVSPFPASPVRLASAVAGVADDRFCNVYRFGIANGAALFCSDSSLPFLGADERLELDRPTLVAVPRHASPTCDRAYPLLKTDNPEEHVWVSSHVPSNRKCSQWFMGMPRSFCVNCRGSLVKEVVAELDSAGWLVLSGNTC